MTERNLRVLRDTVGPEADGMSVGRYLRQKTGLTRAQIRNLKYRENGICVNGSRVRVTHILHTGELLELGLGDDEKGESRMPELDGGKDDFRIPEPDYEKDDFRIPELGGERSGCRKAPGGAEPSFDSGTGSPYCTGASGDCNNISRGENGSSDGSGDDFMSGCNLCETVPDILYEDEDVLIVWKKAGLLVHPACGKAGDSRKRREEEVCQEAGSVRKSGEEDAHQNSGSRQKKEEITLSELAAAYLASRGEICLMRSIGRLDREASGIVVFAKNRIAAARLWEQRKTGSFRKEYLALCEGTLPCDGIWHTVEAPIARLSDTPVKMGIERNGQSAVTHYQALRQIRRPEIPDADIAIRDIAGICLRQIRRPEISGAAQDPVREKTDISGTAGEDPDICTLLRVQIDTGRTHQIRVHMAYLGHPLLGDPLYGTGGAPLGLCAWKVWLLQPFTGQPVSVCGKDFLMA